MATLLGAYFRNLEFSNRSQPFGFVPKRIKRGIPPKLEYVIWENHDIWWLSNGFCHVLQCFAMFCHVLPIISPAFWWDSATWSYRSHLVAPSRHGASRPWTPSWRSSKSSETQPPKAPGTKRSMDLQADFPVATNEIPRSRMRKIPAFLFLVIAEKNPEEPKQIINQQGFGSRCSLNTPNPEPATAPTPGGRLWLLPLVPQVRKPKSSPNPWCSSWETQ